MQLRSKCGFEFEKNDLKIFGIDFHFWITFDLQIRFSNIYVHWKTMRLFVIHENIKIMNLDTHRLGGHISISATFFKQMSRFLEKLIPASLGGSHVGAR